MSVHPRLLLVLLLAVLAAAPAQARLGETLSEIGKNFGKPQGQPSKGVAFWMFEGEDGLLNYSVTFNAKGLSIAEGLKPVRRARFSEKTATDFIATQVAHLEDSKTLRIVAVGEKYRYAGQDFVCAPNEYVALDEPRGLLLIWSKVVDPAVMVVAPEMFQRGK